MSQIGLLDNAQGIHFLGRSPPLLLCLETCDPNRDTLVRVALTELKDILLENQVFRAEHLLLQICAELLRLG